MVNPSNLVALLEKDYKEAVIGGTQDIYATLNAGLNWETDYWVSCALKWIDQGANIDNAVFERLEAIAQKKQYTQKTRQHAFKLAKRWERAKNT